MFALFLFHRCCFLLSLSSRENVTYLSLEKFHFYALALKYGSLFYSKTIV